MDQTDAPETFQTKVIASVAPAPARWAFGLGVQYLLAILVLYIAFAFPPPELALRGLLVVIGLVSLLGAERARRARKVTIYLSRTRLWDSTGREIARIEDVRAVDRGALAFKPSNGFLLRLTHAPGRAWVPGLWWRLGRSVGVGGITPAGATRFMGEMVATLLKERAAEAEAARDRDQT